MKIYEDVHIHSINLIDEKRIANICTKDAVKKCLKRKILFLFTLIFIFISIVCFFEKTSYAKETSNSVLKEQNEIIKTTNMNTLLRNASNITTIDLTSLAGGDQVIHNCSNYLTNKYNSTSHWNECTICGKKYNENSHSYTNEYWTNGDSCSLANKLIHACNCGYSYETSNTREHKLLDRLTHYYNYFCYQRCSECSNIIISNNCTKSDGTRINCNNLGTCKFCGFEYKKAYHEGRIYEATNGKEVVKCRNCNKELANITNYSITYNNKSVLVKYNMLPLISESEMGESKSCYCGVEEKNYISNPKQTMSKKADGSYDIVASADIITTGEFKRALQCVTAFANVNIAVCPTIAPDIEAPVISNITQTNVAVSNEWATGKKIKITGTEN